MLLFVATLGGLLLKPECNNLVRRAVPAIKCLTGVFLYSKAEMSAWQISVNLNLIANRSQLSRQFYRVLASVEDAAGVSLP